MISSLRDRMPRPPAPPWERKEEDPGPRRPEVERPDTDEIIRRMRKVDPDQARRYRQRTGE
jgi:hypothetical protein